MVVLMVSASQAAEKIAAGAGLAAYILMQRIRPPIHTCARFAPPLRLPRLGAPLRPSTLASVRTAHAMPLPPPLIVPSTNSPEVTPQVTMHPVQPTQPERPKHVGPALP